MKQIAKLGCLLMTLLVGVGAASAETATIRTVCPSGCDHSTIQAAINAADAGDTIQLQMMLAHTEASIDVNKKVTIAGQGQTQTIVQAAATADMATERVFTISADRVTLDNFTIRYGNSSSNGGGIANLGEHLVVSNVTVHHNSALRGGGIHAASGASLTLRDATVSGNVAIIAGAGMYADNANMTVEASHFLSNRAGNLIDPFSSPDTFGGGIYARDTFIVVERTSFVNNLADAGGGMMMSGTRGPLQIRSSSFDGNLSRTGGGLYINESTVYVTNSTIENNDAKGGSGGGVFVQAGDVRFANVTIVYNSVSAFYIGGFPISGEAGGIAFAGDGAPSVHLFSSIVAHNTATDGDYPDCNGTFASGSRSLIGHTGTTLPKCEIGNFTTGMLYNIAPLLDAVSGSGAERGYPLLPNSPAIDAGDCAAAIGPNLSTDQRGAPLPVDGDGSGTAECDMGAYEFGSVPTAVRLKSNVVEYSAENAPFSFAILFLLAFVTVNLRSGRAFFPRSTLPTLHQRERT